MRSPGGSAPSPGGIEVEPARVAAWAAERPAPAVIDVREPDERAAGHIAGTDHIPMDELTEAAHSLPRGRPLVFYCRVGGRSRVAAEAFRAAGFDAYTMTGGLLRWEAEGLPLVPEGGRVAPH